MPSSPSRDRRAPWRPTKEELAAARTKKVRDVIADDLDVLFCGINPGLYTAAVGHHFARPGNRFWPALHLGGFTPELMSPFDEEDLLDYGLGITNLVSRTTPVESELSADEFRKGGRALRNKVLKRRPRWLAVVGLGAFRRAFEAPKARIGPQEERFGDTGVWLLPNPSGLNAHYQRPELGREFARLRRAAGLPDRRRKGKR